VKLREQVIKLKERYKGIWLKFAKFLVVGGIGFLIAYGLLWVLLYKVELRYWASMLITQTIATLWNFTGNLLWTFKEQA